MHQTPQHRSNLYKTQPQLTTAHKAELEFSKSVILYNNPGEGALRIKTSSRGNSARNLYLYKNSRRRVWRRRNGAFPLSDDRAAEEEMV